MTNIRTLIVYFLVFLVAAILLNLFGILKITSSELLSYVLIFIGFGLFLNSFGKDKSALLFSSVFIFLWGVILFFINNIEFIDNSKLIFPALALNIGFSFLIVFFDSTKEKVYLIIASIFILVGIAIEVWGGRFKVPVFFNSLLKITVNYWQVVLIAALVFFILKRSERK